MKQLELFKIDGKILRDKGIERAINNADRKIENWSEMAYDFLLKFIALKKEFSSMEFMVEDVRYAASGIIPEPPSERAWGAVMVRAVKNNLIVNNGLRRKKGGDAHCTPAVLWRINTT